MCTGTEVRSSMVCRETGVAGDTGKRTKRLEKSLKVRQDSVTVGEWGLCKPIRGVCRWCETSKNLSREVLWFSFLHLYNCHHPAARAKNL